MQARPMSAHQISILDQTEPTWFERTQDMSGYVLPDITLPPLDEQLDFTYSTAQTENDFFVQNSANPSDEFFWGDQTEAVLGEDSNMFDNSNYSELHNKMKEWLPNISSTEIDEFAKTTMINNEDLMPQIDSENSLVFSKTPKVDKTPSAAVIKKPRHLSIFASEEPHIKEESDFLSSCADVKPNFDLMVAQEVEVTTEEYEEPDSKCHLSSFLLNPASPNLLLDPKHEVIIPSDTVEDPTSPLSCDFGFADDDDLYSLDAPATLAPLSRVCPQLYLNIEAASNQLLSNDLPDTPEVLKPVLKPTDDFDLVNYLLASGDTNNNAITPLTPTAAPTVMRIPEVSQPSSPEVKYGKGKPFKNWGEWYNDSSSEPSTASGRPARKSATKFKKLLLEGRLGSVSPASSDVEDSAPKAKRRRTTSSSRKRLNSDSDRSSVCENSSRYRERRDRNNLSSKRSRQKRKMQLELKKVELSELEAENKRLRKRADELAAVLDKVHASWKEYLVNVKKED